MILLYFIRSNHPENAENPPKAETGDLDVFPCYVSETDEADYECEFALAGVKHKPSMLELVASGKSFIKGVSILMASLDKFA